MQLKLCPKCKQQTLEYRHGCYVDNDTWVCIDPKCDYEHVLETSSYPPKEVKVENEHDLFISGFETEA